MQKQLVRLRLQMLCTCPGKMVLDNSVELGEEGCGRDLAFNVYNPKIKKFTEKLAKRKKVVSAEKVGISRPDTPIVSV